MMSVGMRWGIGKSLRGWEGGWGNGWDLDLDTDMELGKLGNHSMKRGAFGSVWDGMFTKHERMI